MPKATWLGSDRVRIHNLVLIGILIVTALVLAVIGTEQALRLLAADLFCLIVVPVAFYGYQMLLNAKKKDQEDDQE